MGKCKLVDIAGKSGIKSVGAYFEKTPVSIKSDASIMQAIEVASSFVGESIPVISRHDGKLIGVVTEADIFKPTCLLRFG